MVFGSQMVSLVVLGGQNKFVLRFLKVVYVIFHSSDSEEEDDVDNVSNQSEKPMMLEDTDEEEVDEPGQNQSQSQRRRSGRFVLRRKVIIN